MTEGKPAEAAGDDAPKAAAPARTGAPLCFVIDEEPSIRHFLSLILHGSGIDTVEFADGAAMRANPGPRPPDLVFHNISLESADAIDSMIALGKVGVRGAIQLMSNRGAAVLDHVKNIGVQHKLKMLPVLKKPFETDGVVKIIETLKLGTSTGAGARIELSEALKNNWIEFWLQPKINLRKKQLAGAEAFARVRHPQHGILKPSSFLTGAGEADLIKLAELAVTAALKTGTRLSKVGIHLRIAVNMPLAALAKLPVEDLVKTQRPSDDKWPGLIIDLPETEIIPKLGLASELTKKLRPCHVQLAIDDFGRGYSSLTKAKELSFAELKLDRSFVVDCGTDKVNAPMCKTVIDFAHGFGSTVVGVGIEKASDALALVTMGCDYGQGFLLGQPMPEERFIALLRQRSSAADGATKAEASAAVPQPA
ncbi:MAG: EAL domain-containing response regulator [Pseudolabrys sp.]|nr:EAL domain-containing response regulator [Pseudolabrys sp.]